MKLFLASLSLIALCLTLSAIPAMAQSDLYDNGPINGQITGWTIDFGFSVSDSFTLANPATVDGISFGLFLFPGDTLTSAEVQIGGGPFGNQLFDETINFTASNCFVDQFGYNICQETGSFSGVALNAGTYWMTLSNASVPSGDPVFWDQNSGVGCEGSGCPSMAQENVIGTIPSESFTILGNTSSTSTTGTTPEPASLLLLASGILGTAGTLRRKLF